MKRVIAVRGSRDHWKPANSQPYEEALRDAGIEPVLISPEAGSRELPAGISGLVLMGGADVNPRLYGEDRHSETEEPDDARDDLECALIQDALARNLSLLAICRGIQILNVQHGGTLVQHLAGADRHRRRTLDRGSPAHQVEIVPGTKLGCIAGKTAGDCLTWSVNSRHHQAIARVGEGLQVCARDPEDGTIEAVERPDRRFAIGVQWHPENQSANDERQARLFQAFADAL